MKKASGVVNHIPDLTKMSEDVILNSAIQSCIQVLQNQKTKERYIEAAENLLDNPDLEIKSEGFLLLLLRIINNRKKPRNVLVGGSKNFNLAILCEGITITDLTDALSNAKRFTEKYNLAFANIEIRHVGGAAAVAKATWVDGAISLMGELFEGGIKLAEPVAEKLANEAIRKAGPGNIIYYSLGVAANAVKVMAIDNSQAVLLAASKHPLVTFGLGAVVMGVAMFALTSKKGNSNNKASTSTEKSVNKGVNNNTRKGVNNTRKGVNNTHPSPTAAPAAPEGPPAAAPASPWKGQTNKNRKGSLNMTLEEDPSLLVN